jgi:hypothetical protein
LIMKGYCVCIFFVATSVVTIPPHCPALNNCSLRCLHGFVRDDDGCYTCQCQAGKHKIEIPILPVTTVKMDLQWFSVYKLPPVHSNLIGSRNFGDVPSASTELYFSRM